MAVERLGEATQTLYAELLDQVLASEAEGGLGGSGSFVSKEIGKGRYWYLQRLEGDRKRQIYLGRETPELLRQIRRLDERRSDLRVDEARRRELVAMLVAGGMARETAAVSQVLRILQDAGIFRLGGVLVGTQAFTCIANFLGVRFEAQSLRTADIDVAHDPAIALAPEQRTPVDLLSRLKAHDRAFVAVPGLDLRDPSTSFKVRGRDLRVDFLTPARRGGTEKPVPLPHIGVAAHPMPGLAYLIEEQVNALILAGGGIFVNVPTPARFALHKLWVSRQRPVSERAKSRKDLRQAEQILDVLLQDDPDQLGAAWNALSSRRMAQGIRQAMKALDERVRDALVLRIAPM